MRFFAIVALAPHINMAKLLMRIELLVAAVGHLHDASTRPRLTGC